MIMSNPIPFWKGTKIPYFIGDNGTTERLEISSLPPHSFIINIIINSYHYFPEFLWSPEPALRYPGRSMVSLEAAHKGNKSKGKGDSKGKAKAGPKSKPTESATSRRRQGVKIYAKTYSGLKAVQIEIVLCQCSWGHFWDLYLSIFRYG